ncbi:ABC transporter substrate-binding protein [Myxococcota bacterium]
MGRRADFGQRNSSALCSLRDRLHAWLIRSPEGGRGDMQVEFQEEPKTPKSRQPGAPACTWIGRAALGLGMVAALVLVWKVEFAVRNVLRADALASGTPGRTHGRVSLHHAKRFTVEYRADCKLIRVADANHADARGTVYQLVPRGHRPVPVEQGALLVETPVRRVIALGTGHAAAFARLGVPSVLVGVAGVRLLNTPELVAQVRRGELAEVSDGTPSMSKKLDLEQIRTLAPDLILTSFLGNDGSKLQEAGFKVAESSEWLEETPLGRAEWLKFVAAFLDRETEAERLFWGIEQRYEAQVARVQKVKRRPTVLCGLDQRGTWLVPGGRSYVADFIQAAGGDYLWKTDLNTGSQPLKMESVLEGARDAEVWLLHRSFVRSRREILQLDPRYTLFGAFHSGRIYHNDARISPEGGNDYWETGVTNPDLVLADLIAILHPELAPNHQFIWYRQLPEEE